ncbi:MAG: putative katanin p60 catalytic subunit, partial [Streblomastix strix]
VSKWRGDSEKLIRVLFDLARYHAPSTIFIDELDALLGQRGGEGPGVEHEGSRRMKSELLTQMDGLSSDGQQEGTNDSDINGEYRTPPRVFVLGASNLPWDLDAALLRRLEKRILVGLPDEQTRLQMIKKNLSSVKCSSDLKYEEYAKKTEGYSGAEIRSVCKEAASWPVRRLMDKLEALKPDDMK